MAVAKQNPKQEISFPAPLFDRLVDDNPLILEELHPLKTYTMDETLQSISQELHYLLNTRSSAIPYSIYATREDLMSEDLSNRYGLADLPRFDVMESLAAKRLARQIRRTVEHYESRLSNVSVALLGFTENKQLMIQISGIVYAYPSGQRFTFPVSIDRQLGE
jgi:type VI secretion system lysozyme-like protein